MIKSFDRPLHATHHCRHYSYIVPITKQDSGPHCAKGLTFQELGSTGRCMPTPGEPCSLREEYTDAEREAWRAAQDQGMARLSAAVQALPKAIPLRTSGQMDCPNCDGQLHYSRWHRGAEICCTTPNCCGARFNIAASADWPAKVGA